MKKSIPIGIVLVLSLLSFNVLHAQLTANFSFQCTGSLNTISFTDITTNISGAATYAWDFGDGNSSVNQNPNHTFAVDGTYNVKLTVTDAVGNDNTTISVDVSVCSLLHPTTGSQSLTHICDGADAYFYDSGGVGNYIDNGETTTTTFCPDDPSCQKIMIAFQGPLNFAPNDVLNIYESETASGTPTWSSARVGYEFLRMIMPRADCTNNPNGCVTFEFISVDDSQKGQGWLAQISCMPKELSLECPADQNLTGSFITVDPPNPPDPDVPTCNVALEYTIPAPTLGTDSDCVTDANLNFTVTVDVGTTGLEVVDQNGGDIEIGDIIIITADDMSELAQCISINYTATCGMTTLSAQCLNQQVCIDAPSIVCTSFKNVGLNKYCQATITPDLVLMSSCDLFEYTVTVTDEDGNIVGTPNSTSVDIETPGVYEVVVSNGMASCKSTVTMADNFGPVCSGDLDPKFVVCSQADDITSLFDEPTFTDCSGTPTPQPLVPDDESGECGIGIVGDDDGDNVDAGDLPAPASGFTLTDGIYVGDAGGDYEGFEIMKAYRRTWTATDAFGNVSVTSCSQQIYVLRPTVANIKPAQDVEVECGDDISPDALAAIDIKNVPYFIFDGEAYAVDLRCKYAVFPSTELEKDGCGTTVETTRKWDVADCCVTGDPLTSPIVKTFYQKITELDIIAPVMTCPTTTLELTVDSDCEATLNLKTPLVTEVCSAPVTFNYQILDDGGVVVTDDLGNPFSGIGLTEVELDAVMHTLADGNYTIEITAVDDCGNVSDVCAQAVTVIDDTPPTCIITKVKVANIAPAVAPDDAKIEFCASAFGTDATFTDNCKNEDELEVRIRRNDAIAGTPFTKCVDFFCEDVGQTIDVEVRVYENIPSSQDAVGEGEYTGQFTSCVGQVEVQDNNGNCPAKAVCKSFANTIFDLVDNGMTEFTLTASDIDGGSTFDPGMLTIALAPGQIVPGFPTFTCDEEGTFDIILTAAKADGSTDQCTASATIRDAEGPVFSCTNKRIILTDGNPIVLDFSNITENGNPVVFPTDNCKAAADINISFNPPSITCAADNTTQNVTLTISDNNGGTTTCSDLLVLCDFPRIAFKGEISNADGEGLEEVLLRLEGEEKYEIMTDEKGAFEFPKMLEGGSFDLIPFKDIDHLNGVSTFDLVLISQHILGRKELDSPYQFIAADVNNDKKISGSDIVAIRKLILNKVDDFPKNTSWRFIDGDFVFPFGKNPLTSSFREHYLIDELTNDVEVNFLGVKIGDINGDAKANSRSTPRSNTASLILKTDNQHFSKGDLVQIDLTAENFNQILAYQFTMNFENEVLEFINWSTGAIENLADQNFALDYKEEGLLTTSWMNENKLVLNESTVLYSLTFLAKADGELKDAFQINSTLTKAEAYKGVDILRAEFLDVNLKFQQEIPESGFTLYPNKPNPFANGTIISFYLPTATDAKIAIYDVSGKLIKLIEVDANKGYNELTVLAEWLSSDGLYYYQLDTPSSTATRKMIKIN